MPGTKPERIDSSVDVFSRSVALQIEKLMRRDSIDSRNAVTRRFNNESVFERSIKQQHPLNLHESK